MRLIALLLTLFAPTLAFAQPKLYCPDNVYEFGRLPNTEKVEHTFELHNIGDEELEFHTNGGCTGPRIQGTIKPGEKFNFNATLMLSGEGPRTKEITVFSNDPNQPSYILKFLGYAVAAIKFEPQTLDFGNILDEKTYELKLRIFPGEEGVEFNITKLECNQPFLSATVTTLEEHKSYEITVKNTEAFPLGRIAAMLRIETDHKTAKEFRVYISGNIMGDYWVQPDVVRVRYEDTPGKTMNGFLRISPGRVGEFDLVDVKLPNDSIHAEFERQEDAYFIRLYDLPVDDTLSGKEIIIKTNVEGHDTIHIPIVVMHPPKAPENP